MFHNKNNKEKQPTDSPVFIGTQGFSCEYQFNKNIPPQLEQAQRAFEMGSRLFKTSVNSIEDPTLSVLDIDFDTYFFWWRSDGKIWYNGLSNENKTEEYEKTKAFAKKLLLENADKDRTFFLGHWEGDWYLLDNNINNTPSQKTIDGMIAWLTVRQKAVDDARAEVLADHPNLKAKIYHYTEVNRVRDALEDNSKKRVVNSVLPHVAVDYVSYSSYDVQALSQDDINKTIAYIEKQIPKKNSIQGPRVFIGECALPAINFHNDPIKHEEANRNIFIKFLNSGVLYILYWQVYNNEMTPQKQERGYWLIDDKNEIWPLYTTLNKLCKENNSFNGNRQEMITWLESYRPQQEEKKIIEPLKTKSTQSSFSQFSQANKEKVEPKILLYKTDKNELAVKFPDEATLNSFLKQLGGKQKYKEGFYPMQSEKNKTTLFFPGYKAKNAQFTGIFPSAEMRNSFLAILISDKEKLHTTVSIRINNANEYVMHFKDQAFFQPKGNVKLPVPESLQQDPSLSLKK